MLNATRLYSLKRSFQLTSRRFASSSSPQEKASEAAQKASEAAGSSTSHGELVPQVEYLKDEFLKRVVQWTVVSDQVSSPMIHYMFWLLMYAFQPFTEVESPELWNIFLLLCDQLALEDIPG